MKQNEKEELICEVYEKQIVLKKGESIRLSIQ